MKKRFLALLFVVTSLYAVPNIDQLKQAVKANPALLNTPEAQAAMKEKGIDADDVKAKLMEQNSDANLIPTEESATNKIDFPSESDTTQGNEASEAEDHVKMTNPFTIQESEKIKKALLKKQLFVAEKKLTRYASRFYANKNQVDAASMPTPDDYIITSGDVLSVNIYGDRDQNYELDVKNDGTITIPFLGPIKLGGMRYKEAKTHLQKTLSNHFKLSSFNINISKYSTIQVTLVGEVKAPGLYNLSSFSSIKDLLVTAQGVRENASVRDIIIKRGAQTTHIDFYDLLFGGKELGETLLKHGDIIVIGNASKLASIDGYVNNSAIFELKENEKLDKLIAYASGMKPNASKVNIKVKRFSDNQAAQTLNLTYDEAKNFKMQNGDNVYVYPLDFSTQQSVNIYGNIIRPGSYDLGGAKSLSELIKSHTQSGLKNFFLPQTHFEYGVIKRYDENLSYTILSFDLTKVIANAEDILLVPQDEIYIFNQNDIYTNTYVTTKGKNLIQAGKLQYFAGMSARDAINASVIDGIMSDTVRITTINTPDNLPLTQFISYKNQGDFKLSPFDEIEVYDYYDTTILKPVTIEGEVVNPLSTFFEENMSVAKLIRFAGGFTNEAYKQKLEIVRYFIDENHIRQRTIITKDLNIEDPSQIILQPYDEVTIFRIPKWSEKMSVTLKGQVMLPGTYTIEEGETLSSVLARAGGFTDKAFIEGAIFTRESVRQRQIEEYNKALARIKRELAIFNAMPANAAKSATMGQASNTLNEVVLEAQKYQPIGRVTIALESEIEKIAQSGFDIRLQDKDTLFIPSYIDTVTVFGEVYNPTSFIYQESKGAEDYIMMASGYSKAADEDNAYVIRADGSSIPLHGSWFSAGVEIRKGDTIVVPIYIKEHNTLEIWDSVAKILSSFAVTAAALNSLGITQ